MPGERSRITLPTDGGIIIDHDIRHQRQHRRRLKYQGDAGERRSRNSDCKLEHAKEFDLTAWRRNEMSVQLTIALAAERQPRISANAELFNELDITETKAGLRTGAQAIGQCKLHRPPRCECWRPSRLRVWHIQDAYGARSPEAWAATRIWDALEEMESASTPEPSLKDQ